MRDVQRNFRSRHLEKRRKKELHEHRSIPFAISTNNSHFLYTLIYICIYLFILFFHKCQFISPFSYLCWKLEILFRVVSCFIWRCSTDPTIIFIKKNASRKSAEMWYLINILKLQNNFLDIKKKTKLCEFYSPTRNSTQKIYMILLDLDSI